MGLHALAALPPGKVLLVPIAVRLFIFRIFSLVQVLFVTKIQTSMPLIYNCLTYAQKSVSVRNCILFLIVALPLLYVIDKHLQT